MISVTLVSPYVESTARAAKLCALYFDKIFVRQSYLYTFEVDPSVPEVEITGKGVLVQGIVRGVIPLVDDTFLREVQLLRQEGILDLLEESRDELDDPLIQALFDASERQAPPYRETEVVLDDRGSKVSSHITFEEEEMLQVLEKHHGPLQPSASVSPSFVCQYYDTLLVTATDALLGGSHVLTASAALDRLLQRCYSDEVVNSPRLRGILRGLELPRMVTGVLAANLPDASELETEEILEARDSLRDELLSFRQAMATFCSELVLTGREDEILRHGEEIVHAQIIPRVKDIERKARGARIGVLKKLFAALQKPDAYVPLIGTAFAGIPVKIAMMVSLGILAADVALDYLAQRDELRGDGLWYVVNLRRRLKG